MTRVTFKNNTPAVQRYYKFRAENGVRGMGRAFRDKADRRAPYQKKGALRAWRSDMRTMQGSPTLVMILKAAYAQYQERGMRRDGSRVVRKYTTPGTGRHFVKNAVDQIKPVARSFFR